ncbi:hypothetical protein QAD02_010252 [Eretmocerus hayati]|uniref:Uncharacterized protein n=1 Tax=Eretmocerus hayati TaxID=131215 RepID=A0ACC2NBJ9_9HYME|nr:hypothetical protein QAD02_010252 [Eretmocerus hayati]
MSPASQGALEVERYIGSCLISSTGRPLMQKPLQGGCRSQEQQQQASQFRIPPKQIGRPFDSQCQPMSPTGGTWAGGMPLISMASSSRRGNPRNSPGQHQVLNDQVSGHMQARIPLSRLAVHTQGAPLIVSGRYHNNRTKVQGGSNPANFPGGSTSQPNLRGNQPPRSNNKPTVPDQKRMQQQQPTPCNRVTDASGVSGKDATVQGTTSANIDSLSIASDESSGSNNSENSLPRIIKPRKRRKKDRKPLMVNPVTPNNLSSDTKPVDDSQQSNVPVSASIAVTTCARSEPPHQAHQPHFVSKCYESGSNGLHFLHDYNDPVTLTCAHDASIDDCLHPETLCRCRYCDSATVIWDVADTGGFQDFGDPRHRPHPHHHHHHRFSHVPATVFVRPIICPDHHVEFYDDAPCLHLRPTSSTGAAILRRSWSDPTSYFTEDLIPNRDVGVIGDRGQNSESPRSSWRGDASTASPNTSLGPSSPGGASSDGSDGCSGTLGPLEVSTEIVTSPNGHRDLEIKFYSSCGVAEENDEDSKQFEDIWSYHESKLQQDFRILLQAEE